MRKHYLFFILFVSAIYSNAQSLAKTMLRLPDTGETSSYTSTFGEDNDYTINPPFFIENADGTVTDTVTGLMWQKTDGGEMTIDSAAAYCDTLTLADYNNWRLPNAHESFSILNHQHANPALDATVFTTTAAEYWWTSDRQANDSNKVWVTNAGGGIGNHPKTETVSAGGTKKFHVRAVRDVTAPPQIPNHFTDNGDGTITDQLTGLMWQKTPLADTITWEQALNYADTLSLTGTADWRLPNIKELQSINDESRINPSLNTNYFNAGGAKKYWSSTTLPNQTTKAWYLDTQFGITTYDFKTARYYLICVRGNINTTTAVNEATPSEFATPYPNPFTTSIQLLPKKANALYELCNSVGQLIYSGREIETQNFSLLPSGVYFLSVQQDTTVTYKLVKE
jgi:hypothetical protein